MFRKIFGCALLMLALAASSAAAAQTAGQAGPARPLEIPTAADFGALPTPSDPVLAPDGKHVAARGLVNGKALVLIVDITTPHRPVTPVTIPDKNRVEWLRWAGSGRLLLSLSYPARLRGESEEVRVTRIFSLDLATGKQMLVSPAGGIDGDDLVFVDPAGAFALLSIQATIFEYPSVYRVDLVTGNKQEIVLPREHVWDWFADSTGVVRAGLAWSDGKSWMIYRSNAKGDFKRVARRDGKGDNHLQQVMAVPGSDQGYAVADGRNGHLALYRYDFAADALGDLLYENPNFDVDDFELSRMGSLLGVYYTAERPEIAWFDPALKALQARIDQALPGAIDRITATSTDQQRLLVWTGSASDPGAYYLYDRATNTLNLLAETHKAVSGKQLSAMEPVRYPARDGLEIPGYLTLPAGRAGTKLPLVVMPHGGPFVRDSWGYDPWVQYLASRGYAVLQPNFRGSTGFGQRFVERGDGQWGRGMQDDIDDGVKWLAAKGVIDPKRVCIMGASFGGYAAMWAAVRNPELYRCAISFAGISDVGAMLRYDRTSFSAPRYFRDWRDRVRGDRSFELDQISPLKAVERMTVPILIAHGADDDNVPVSQSRRLHEALLKLGRAHDYVIYPDEGHGFTDPAHSTDFLNRVGAFLDKYNPS